MKITCQVVEDLLPLYHDGVCSEDSRALVEEHLKTCPKCGNMNRALNEEPEQQVREEQESVRGIKKGIRRLTVRGIALGIALVLLLTACGAGLYYVNWNRKRETMLRFVEGKNADKTYRHTWAGGIWDGRSETFRWSNAGYRFLISIDDPLQGESVITVIPLSNSTLFDTDGDPYIWLSVEYGRKDGYCYRVSVEKPAVGLGETFVVNGELKLLQQDERTQLLLDVYRSEIQDIVQAAQAEWPFLNETAK